MQSFELQQVDYDDIHINGTANGPVDPVFKKVPKNSTGFHIWRIDNMNLVPLSRDQYGIFYDGDSYIIYAASQLGHACGTDTVTREIRGAPLEYHIHFWLGNATTADKSGVAAYKTVELDGYLGGLATQHRETQGNESARFKSYYKNGLRILKGSQSTNISNQDATTNNKAFQAKLYKVKGKRNPVIIQQESVSWKYFNSGDVFIILAQKLIFVWVGRAANSIEKLHATKAAIQLKSETNASTIVFVDDGYEQSIQNDHKTEFQKYLPLNQRHVLPSEQTDDGDAEKQHRSDIRLYRCSDNSGKYRVTELKSGPLMQSDLDSDDVFILDHGLFGIWVWVGKQASDKERSEAMRNARGFVKKKKYPNETRVTRVIDGAEPIEFKMLFISWKNKEEPVKVKSNSVNKTTKIAITKFDVNLMHDRPMLAAETQLLDDGSGTTRLWRMNKKEAIEINKERFGNFFNSDCYLMWYSYQYHGQKHILYTWFGLHASEEEMNNAFVKATEIDNELGGVALLVRVIQGREPTQFLQIFKGRLIVFRGKGIDFDETGKNSKTPTTYLLHIQGSASYNTKATQVATKSSSLNSNYCFVLRKAKRYYVWSGLNSTGDQREMAKHFTGKDFELTLEGKEPQEFWELLGGKQNYITNKLVQDEDELKNPRLFHCSITSEKFKVEEVFNFNQNDLVPEDIMLLDAYNAIFLWMGKLSNARERRLSFEIALEYLRTDPAGRDVNTPIVQVKQGNEPPIFTGFFKSWDKNWWTEHVSFDELRCELEGITNGKENGNKNGSIGRDEDDFDKYDKYPISILRESSEKLPNKVDPLQKELYLTHDDFVFIFKMKYQEFKNLPKWKQQELKKKSGLF